MKKTTRSLCGVLAASFAVTTFTGCAAGNFGLTRKVAQFNLSLSMIPRVIIGILFIPVYAVTLMFDFILNNTLEFWTNSPMVTAQTKTFIKDGYRVVVNHTRNPLRKSVFTVYGKDGRVISVSELREMQDGSIAVYVNGLLQAQVQSLTAGLTEISVPNPSNPKNVIVKLPENLTKTDSNHVREIKKVLEENDVISAVYGEAAI